MRAWPFVWLTWLGTIGCQSHAPDSTPTHTAASPSLPDDATAPATPSTGDDRMVDIGGGISLHLHCVGQGTPTVVIDNGHGADSTSWSRVLDDFGRITRTCVYDRAGIGLSPGPAPKHHSFRQMAHELHALLERAAIPGPYVLVAHSMGGLNVRLFQSEHPDEVVGMVLVDPETEASAGALIDMLQSLGPDKLRALREQSDPEGGDYDTMVAGFEDIRASARPLGDMPLVVLSAGVREQYPPDFKPEAVAAYEKKTLEGHEMVTHLSTNSAHAIADHSGDFIQIDAPRLVIAAVKQVVDAVRTNGRVDAKALEPFVHDGPHPPKD